MRHTLKPTVYLPIKGTILRETVKALLLSTPDNKEYWLPISQMVSIVKPPVEDPGAFTICMVAEWILKEKGIIQSTLTANEQARVGTKERTTVYPDRSSYRKPSIEDDEIPF